MSFSPSANLDPRAYLWGAMNPIMASIGTSGHLGIFTLIYSPLSTGVPFLDDIWGPSTTYPTTAATIGSIGGAHIYKILTNRARNPVMNCIFKLNQTADTLLYIGLWDSISTPTSLTTDPLNAKHGVGLVIDGGMFKVAHNEGSGSTVLDDLQPTTSIDTGIYILTINVDSTSSGFKLSLTKYATGNSPSQLIVTSEIPDPTQGLTGAIVLATQAAAIKEIVVYRWEMFC